MFSGGCCWVYQEPPEASRGGALVFLARRGLHQVCLSLREHRFPPAPSGLDRGKETVTGVTPLASCLSPRCDCLVCTRLPVALPVHNLRGLTLEARGWASAGQGEVGGAAQGLQPAGIRCAQGLCCFPWRGVAFLGERQLLRTAHRLQSSDYQYSMHTPGVSHPHRGCWAGWGGGLRVGHSDSPSDPGPASGRLPSI